MNCSPPGSSVRGILQARKPEWVAVSSPGDLPHPGMGPRSPALLADSLPSKPPGRVLKFFHWKAVSLFGLSEFSSVQSLSHVQLFATPWTAARQASQSINNPQSPPRPMSTESVMPSNHLVLCRPLLLLPSIFPSIRVFSHESVLHIRWPKCWSFSSASVLPVNIQD